MKLLKNISGFGPLLVLGGYLWYSIFNVWSIPLQIVVYLGAALMVLWIGINFERIKSSFGKRSTQYGTNTVLMIAIVIGLLGLVNFLGKKHHKRFDLTSAQLYSLSDQTEKVVKGVKTEVNIYHFAKERSPAWDDLLTEYKDLNPAKINYRVIDPQKDPGLAKQFKVRSFGETVVACGEKNEKVESSQEEAVTNAILKVTREKNKVIYFLQNHKEGDLESRDDNGYATLKKAIGNQNYEVKTLTLAQNPSIPDDCAALIIAGPKVALLPTEVSLIDKYVDAGGKVLLLEDPDTDVGLGDLLKKWKLALDNDIVVDSSGLGQLFGMGPAAPLVATYETHPITKDMANSMTIFPMTRSVKTVENPESQFNSQVLFKTSENSWGETNLKGGSAEYNEGKDVKGPVALGAVSTKTISGDEKAKKYGKEARVVIIGDSQFANNNYIRLQRNGDLILNTISWLAEDEDLISIRAKSVESRTVQMTMARSRTLFWLSLIFLPGCVLVAGIVVWIRRR
jgi:ABC-type uncharacterized transport system involved in gliding motility auxiliary subunit